MIRRVIVSGILSLTGVAAHAQAHQELVVFAAGSLRAAMIDVGKAFEAAEPSTSVRFNFGASGLLKDRIAGGEPADVFASANMEHPQALVSAGKAAPVQRFARNVLCALVSPRVAVTPDTLIDRLMDSAVKVGTSTPKADPSGDYAWTMFERIEQSGRAGAFKVLSEKALQLTGGPNSPSPPAGVNVYGALVAAGQADVFITYCTSAAAAMDEQPTLRTVAVPSSINVNAEYGVVTLRTAAPQAERFVAFLLAPSGRAILARQGFVPG